MSVHIIVNSSFNRDVGMWSLTRVYKSVKPSRLNLFCAWTDALLKCSGDEKTFDRSSCGRFDVVNSRSPRSRSSMPRTERMTHEATTVKRSSLSPSSSSNFNINRTTTMSRGRKVPRVSPRLGLTYRRRRRRGIGVKDVSLICQTSSHSK